MKRICAPLATLGHPAFRIMIEKFGGCDEYYTEMINAASLLNNGQFENYYTNPAPVPEKIVWQLVGKSAASFIAAARILCRLPGIGIDLNMGCSAPEIFKSGAGIAWMMKDSTELTELVAGVRHVLDEYEAETGVHRRLSVKCRLGADDFTDEDFFRFIDTLVSCGVEQIAVHPRTRKEKYREKPRYEYAQKTAVRCGKKACVIVNGDICDKKSSEQVSALCPDCGGLMLGRAAVQKPWIFAELAGLLPEKRVDLLEIALSFIEDVTVYQPPEFWRTRLQRFFSYYTKNFSFSHYACTKLLNARTPGEAADYLRSYFAEVPGDRILCFS